MNYSKLLIATVAGAVVNFLAGWLIYGILFANSMNDGLTAAAKATMKPMEQHHIAFYFVGSHCTALMLAYIYERWTTIRSLVPGMIAGAITIALLSLSIDSQFMAGMDWYTSMTPVLMNTVMAAIFGGLTGGVVGWALGWNRA